MEINIHVLRLSPSSRFLQIFFGLLLTCATIQSTDLMSDTWIATDGLGRSIPSDVRLPKPNRFVGVFYFLWLGFETTDGPDDISKILTAHPNAMQEPNNTAWDL